jgi:lysophospholipase L1-like esterase
MSNGTSTRFNARMSMRTQMSGVSWSLFSLRYIDCNTSNKANGNTLDLQASIEYPAGTFWPITWPNNSQEILLGGGQLVDSLMAPVVIPANTRFWVRVYGVVPASGKWPLYSVVTDGNTGSGQEQGGDALPSKTKGGTIANVGETWSFLPPLWVTAQPQDPTGCLGIGILGDSIAAGANDSTYSEYHGFAQRGLANYWGWINLAESGYQLNTYSTAVGRQWRWQAMPALSHVLITLGTNDLGAGFSLSAMQNGLKTINSSLGALGMIAIPCTLTPRTNSANTGPYPGDLATVWNTRQNYNSWVRANPLHNGFIDLAAVTEANSSNLWRADLGTPSSDGIHPATALHTAMANQLRATLISMLAA